MNNLSFGDFERSSVSQLYAENFANARDLQTGWKDLKFPCLSGDTRREPRSLVRDPGRQTDIRSGSRAIGDGHCNFQITPPSSGVTPRVTKDSRDTRSGRDDARAFMQQVKGMSREQLSGNEKPFPKPRDDIFASKPMSTAPPGHTSHWNPSSEMKALGCVSARPLPSSSGRVSRPQNADSGHKGTFVNWSSN